MVTTARCVTSKKGLQMSIEVETQDAAVQEPVVLEVVNRSGANVEVFIFLGSKFDASHAFDAKEKSFSVPVAGLTPGAHLGAVMVRAEKNLNRMYSVFAMLNGEIVAAADGNIPSDTDRDSGVGTFTLTVGGVQ